MTDGSRAARRAHDPPFLSEDALRAANDVLRLPVEKIDALGAALARVRESPAVRRLASRWYSALFMDGGMHAPADISAWPVPTHDLGDLADLFPAVVLIRHLPRLRAWYADRGIPFSVLVETMSDLDICMEEYRVGHGKPGLGASLAGWLSLHFTGRLFRLGRLQFVPGKFHGRVRVLRETEDRRIAMLCEPGAAFDEAGELRGPGGSSETGAFWKSELVEEAGSITGNPVSPDGLAVREKATLDLRVWKPVLSPTDAVLDVHIPRGPGMTRDACRESYRQAGLFFADHRPDLVFKGFVCESWLLSPSLRRLLPEEANIIGFQNEYRRYPIPADGSMVEAVFGSAAVDLPSFVARTSLQRALRDHLLQGRRIASAGGVIVPP